MTSTAVFLAALAAATAAQERITFTEHVAPIVYERCAAATAATLRPPMAQVKPSRRAIACDTDWIRQVGRRI